MGALWEANWREAGGQGDFDLTVTEAAYESGVAEFVYDSLDNPHFYALMIHMPDAVSNQMRTTVLGLYIQPRYRSGKNFLRLVTMIRDSAMRHGSAEVIFSIPKHLSKTVRVFRRLCGNEKELLFTMDLDYSTKK